jgi:hypothetical protein
VHLEASNVSLASSASESCSWTQLYSALWNTGHLKGIAHYTAAKVDWFTSRHVALSVKARVYPPAPLGYGSLRLLFAAEYFVDLYFLIQGHFLTVASAAGIVSARGSNQLHKQILGVNESSHTEPKRQREVGHFYGGHSGLRFQIGVYNHGQ